MQRTKKDNRICTCDCSLRGDAADTWGECKSRGHG